MNFVQLEFAIFLLATLVATWRSPTKATRHAVLLLASYYFYAYWDWRFCGLLALSTVADFFIAKRIHASERASVRCVWLWLSLAINLGMLGYFKYANFFIQSARELLEPSGWNLETLPIILPVGISFFTFQTMSYTIDVYRRKLLPIDSLLNFGVYVAFFPQLVAGPIVRASEFLPQLKRAPQFSKRRMYGGCIQILRGLFKKALIADRLAEMSDPVFQGPDLYHGLTVLLAVLAYAGQIYYDFSGYTDIAIGAAKTLGYRFPINFRHPYLACSPSEFWRRWHITLSRWLRDYLFIPLGGSRGGTWRTARNLMVTMVLGGLWHGAAWTFVLWGFWHGLALIASRAIAMSRLSRLPGRNMLAWLATLLIVVVGWVPFRATSLADADTIFERIGTMSPGILWWPPLPLAALAFLVVDHAIYRTRLRIATRLRYQAWYSPIVVTIILWCLLLYAPRDFQPFVYFQF